jgi:hypothetical protein
MVEDLKVAAARVGRALVLLALPALGLAATTFHRQWQWYAQDVGRSAAQLEDSGYIVSGEVQVSTNVFGAVVARTNQFGDTTAVSHILNLDTGGGFSCRLSDGGYALLAESAKKILVRKYNAAGESAWDYRSTWGGPISAFVPTFDGGCLVAGRIPDTAHDMGVIKLAADGHEEWARCYDEPRMFDSWARDVSQTRDSGYIICGDANDYVSSNLRLVRLTPNGDTVWTKLYHGPVGPALTAVREMTDSGFLAVGEEFDTLNNRDALYMMRTTSHGDTVWTRQLAPTGAASQAAAMCATSDGGYAIAATIDWGDSARAWLLKLDANADTVWTSVLPGSGKEQAADVQQTADGGYVVAGTSDSAGGSVLLIKTDSLGLVPYGVAEGKPAFPERIALSVAPNPASGGVRVKWSLPAGARPAALRVYDSQGRLVHSSFVIHHSSLSLGLRSFPAGVYLLRLDSSFGSATRKLVVE